MRMTTTCTCGKPIPTRPINANTWIADPTETKFGGHYERRDFCSVECAKNAPTYQAPKRERQARRAPVVYGDMGQLAVMYGQVKVAR